MLAFGLLKMSFLGFAISTTLGELSRQSEMSAPPSELLGIRYGGFVVLLDDVETAFGGAGFEDDDDEGTLGASGLMNVAFGAGTIGLLGESVKAFLSGLALPNCGSSEAS